SRPYASASSSFLVAEAGIRQVSIRAAYRLPHESPSRCATTCGAATASDSRQARTASPASSSRFRSRTAAITWVESVRIFPPGDTSPPAASRFSSVSSTTWSRPPPATRARNSLKIELSNPGSARARPSEYFQSIRVRTASAACRAGRSSAIWKTVTKARRPARLAAFAVGARELLIGQPLAQLVTDHHRQRALPLAPVHRGNGRDDLRRGLRPRPRLDRHHGLHLAAGTREKATAARSC